MSDGEPHDRTLVLDTSVAVEFYLPEELREETLGLLVTVEAGALRLLAPGTVQPELFNALWQRRRRGELSQDEVREFWYEFSNTSVELYAPEDLMPRAAEITLETGVIVYDALFLALAEYAETVVVTADSELLRAVEGTPFTDSAHPLYEVGGLL